MLFVYLGETLSYDLFTLTTTQKNRYEQQNNERRER